ncbi:hypothetical protein RJT34_11250 [Clitoria ternatea]|uniref:Uncharacterized protein n=1 Tax=Clitoria ternatea TaxID=43366 RepID=A0AAN9JLR7_CLITE
MVSGEERWKDLYGSGFAFDLEPGQLKRDRGQHEEHESFGDVCYLAKRGARSSWEEYSTERLKETKTAIGNTVLHLAARYGNDELVDMIVEKCPELLFSLNNTDETPLHVVARGGHISTALKLLHFYANRKWSEIHQGWRQKYGLQLTFIDKIGNLDNKINMDGLLELIKLDNNRRNNMLHVLRFEN